MNMKKILYNNWADASPFVTDLVGVLNPWPIGHVYTVTSDCDFKDACTLSPYQLHNASRGKKCCQSL